ncbi:uncharacterized protein LOC111131742 [Crassostrea virginica]
MQQWIFHLVLAIIVVVYGQIPVESPTDFLNTAPQVDPLSTRTTLDGTVLPADGLLTGDPLGGVQRQGILDGGFTLPQETRLRQLPVDGIIPSEPRALLPRQLPLGDPLSGEPGRPLQISPSGQCPTFLSRYEGDILVINLVPGTCDMLIFVQDQTHLFPAAAGILFNTGAGRILLPMVTFRGNSTTESIATGCPMIPLRYLGPRIVLDTIPGRCQIVLGIRRFPILDQSDIPGLPAEPRLVTRAVFERTSGIL